MNNIDLSVLQDALAWRRSGHRVTLATVVATWGSAPRPPGALLAMRDDGIVSGSVSGGCVEDDLIERVKNQRESIDRPQWAIYGVSKEEAARFGLPCGGTLKLILEPLTNFSWIEELLARCQRHELVARALDLASGAVTLQSAQRGEFGGAALELHNTKLVTLHGPRWRLLLIGAGQLSRYVARMASMLDYEVLVCDPRVEYTATWDVPDTRLVTGMPDDAVLTLNLDAHSAVVALTHDPKLDDMALLEALKSPAFYVGALGSRVNNARRRERLALFDLSADEIARLHGPVGLAIGSRTPPEIAVSILAEMTAIRNGIESRHLSPADLAIRKTTPACGS